MSETPPTPGSELRPPPNPASPAWWRRNPLVLVLSALLLALAVALTLVVIASSSSSDGQGTTASGSILTPSTPAAGVASAHSSTPTSATPTTSAYTSTAAPTTPAMTYRISCQSLGTTETTFTSLDQAWASTGELFNCFAQASGTPTPTDQSAVALYQQGGTTQQSTWILGHLIGVCADENSRLPDVAQLDRLDGAGALILCPNHPQVQNLQLLAEGNLIGDGNFTVGRDITPGTWTTLPGIKDCYWERTSKSGATLDNDYVSYAPNGATVTIRSSDGGFVSQGCAAWTRSA
jgi:hypothetical protein